MDLKRCILKGWSFCVLDDVFSKCVILVRKEGRRGGGSGEE